MLNVLGVLKQIMPDEKPKTSLKEQVAFYQEGILSSLIFFSSTLRFKRYCKQNNTNHLNFVR